MTNSSKGDLSEAQISLEQALDLDNEYLPALIDLAYFQLNVMDDAEAATLLLTKAFSVSGENITEVVLGLA